MAASFKTKEVEVFGPAGQVSHEPSVSRKVDFQPMSSKLAYDTFGVEGMNSYQLFDDVDGAEFYQQGGKVVYDGADYAILGVMVWDTLSLTSHVHVLLAKK